MTPTATRSARSITSLRRPHAAPGVAHREHRPLQESLLRADHRLDALRARDDLQVPFTKDVVKDAPRLDVDEQMTEFPEQELWSYYGDDYAATAASDSDGYGTTYTQARADEASPPAGTRRGCPRRERLRRYEDRRAR